MLSFLVSVDCQGYGYGIFTEKFFSPLNFVRCFTDKVHCVESRLGREFSLYALQEPYNGVKDLKSKMPRPSRLEAFLKSFPESHRGDIEGEILKCRDSKSAHTFLKGRYKYKGSYDSVKNWRQARLERREIDRLSHQSSKIANAAARMPVESDPIASAMNLAQELNSLCASLTALLQRHEWFEDGEVRLNNREAAKILTALPSLARAANSSIFEAHTIKGEIDQRAFALAILAEFGEDWRRTLEHENSELIPMFQEISAITKSRLDLDRPTLLEQNME